MYGEVKIPVFFLLRWNGRRKRNHYELNKDFDWMISNKYINMGADYSTLRVEIFVYGFFKNPCTKNKFVRIFGIDFGMLPDFSVHNEKNPYKNLSLWENPCNPFNLEPCTIITWYIWVIITWYIWVYRKFLRCRWASSNSWAPPHCF